MAVAATAEGYAGFSWIFGLWEQAVVSLLAATSPLIEAVNAHSVPLVGTVTALWLFRLLKMLADGQLLRGLLGGAVIFLAVLYGLRSVSVALPSGATVQTLAIQAMGLQFTMGMQTIYRLALEGALEQQMLAGTILPAQASVDDAVARSMQLYAGTDLARLIRDFNASCAPSPRELAGPEQATKIEALHAVGLLGGGGLGIPDDEIGLLAQARAVSGGVVKLLTGSLEENGGWLNFVAGGAARQGVSQASDLASISARRERGVEALKTSGPFIGDSYVLPTRAHWRALFSGESAATASYLPISSIPGQKSALVDADGQAIRFRPSGCVEAYQIAQLGAEQAYRALRDVGGEIAGGQQVSAEVGAVSTASAWQRFLASSLQKTTGLSSGGAEVAAGTLAAVQMFRDLGSWLDLQTLLPGYVLLSAWLYLLVLFAAPVFLLMAPLRGGEVLIGWFKLLLFPIFAMFFAHFLICAMSLVFAAVALGQSAAASGWTGAGAEFDALRGFMGAMAAVLLAISTWIASAASGVSIGGLAGSLSGAMATATGVGGFVTRAVGTVVAVKRLGAVGAAGAARQGGGPGGSSPGGGAGAARSAVNSQRQMHQTISSTVSKIHSAAPTPRGQFGTLRPRRSLNPGRPEG